MAAHHDAFHCRTGTCAVELLLVPVTTSGLVYHGDIMCSSFIMLDISSIHKVKLSIIHQLAHQVFCGLGLFPPPACKERLQTMPFFLPFQTTPIGYTGYAEPSMGFEEDCIDASVSCLLRLPCGPSSTSIWDGLCADDVST